ncbi:lymphocyte function-associated antigen 3 isoform X2 [Phascolarctos cinereus]|uniref:Lymphocyte function-associated antigen 3 isoform X2 n=1 Tax=Phascolarctos cinereus TaxID=38626 RepID=A0A6P5LJF0_PHACI|nr:lymphocyte function-associated antigen 3 isoform X2 [Phascolarctos cinereus]
MATEFFVTKILMGFALGLITFCNLGNCELVEIFGLMSSNVTLSPLQKMEFKDITWKKGKNKVAERRENVQDSFFGPFEKRGRLDQSGNFTILNLMASDEGQYEIESLSLTASETLYLYVLEKLLQPDLYCSFDGENITVSCNGSEDSRFLNYEWLFPGSYVIMSPSKVLLRNAEDFQQTISCVTRNPVSTNESSLFLKTCVPER